VIDPRAEFLTRARRGGMVPLTREVVLDADTPVAALAKVARPPFAFLLESLVGGERWARYTFLGTEPREVWRYRGTQIERWTRATGWASAGETADPIGHLQQQPEDAEVAERRDGAGAAQPLQGLGGALRLGVGAGDLARVPAGPADPDDDLGRREELGQPGQAGGG